MKADLEMAKVPDRSSKVFLATQWTKLDWKEHGGRSYDVRKERLHGMSTVKVVSLICSVVYVVPSQSCQATFGNFTANVMIVHVALAEVQSCSSDTDNAADFIRAVSESNFSRLDELINAGVDVNVKNEHGVSPLMVAALKGKTEIAKMLIVRGAVVNASSEDGWSPLMYAAFAGATETLYLLLSNGAKVENRAQDGWTPLMAAASGGHKRVVEALVSNGANVNARYKDGRTPLILACEGGHLSIAEILIRSGGDVNARTETGETALMAASVRNDDLVGLLLGNRARIDEKDQNGFTVLILAAQSNNASP